MTKLRFDLRSDPISNFAIESRIPNLASHVAEAWSLVRSIQSGL